MLSLIIEKREISSQIIFINNYILIIERIRTTSTGKYYGRFINENNQCSSWLSTLQQTAAISGVPHCFCFIIAAS